MVLPKDILIKIEQTYDVLSRKLVINKLLTLWDMNLNVGAEQLARSILIISDGKIDLLEAIFESNFQEDPRDLIMTAMEKSDNKAYYGNKPFEF